MIGPWPLRRSSGALVAIALLLPLAMLSSRSAGAQTRARARQSSYSSRIDTTFAFDKSGSITVNATDGEIVVTGWSRDQVHVRAVSDDENVRFDASSSRLTLEIGGARRGGDARFELSVPYGVRVLATSRSGDITLRGTRGQVETHSQNGDVRADDVTGRLDVHSVSGGLEADNVTGDAEISTVSGDVKLGNVHGTIDVGTVSGDVDLRGVTSSLVRAKTLSGEVTFDGIVDPAGRYELVTHSGDIKLRVQRDISAQLTVSTWSGAIDSDFPITLKPGEHGIGLTSSKRFTFQIGAGAARITTETFSGDITISSNGHGTTERR